MQEMKGRIRKNSNGWLVINSLNRFSTRINIDFIRQIKITTDAIKIQIEKDWIAVRRYNQKAIEIRLKESKIWHKDFYDRLYAANCVLDETEEEREQLKKRGMRNSQEGERYYLESLDKNLAEKDWEEACKNTTSNKICWLKDKDFDYFKQQLESLSDNFALNVRGKEK